MVLPVCRIPGACHYLTNRFQMEAPVVPSRSLQEGSAKPWRGVSSRRLRGASKAPPRTLRGGLRTLRGGCTYRRLRLREGFSHTHGGFLEASRRHHGRLHLETISQIMTSPPDSRLYLLHQAARSQLYPCVGRGQACPPFPAFSSSYFYSGRAL